MVDTASGAIGRPAVVSRPSSSSAAAARPSPAGAPPPGPGCSCWSISLSRAAAVSLRGRNDEIKVVGELLAIRNERKPLWSGVHVPYSKQAPLASNDARSSWRRRPGVVPNGEEPAGSLDVRSSARRWPSRACFDELWSGPPVPVLPESHPVAAQDGGIGRCRPLIDQAHLGPCRTNPGCTTGRAHSAAVDPVASHAGLRARRGTSSRVSTRSARNTGCAPLYLCWFGPRRLASIVFAVLGVEKNIPQASTILDATELTVTASIVLYLQGIDPEEIITALRKRHAPMVPASAGLRL
jgi:hypothetical protein